MKFIKTFEELDLDQYKIDESRKVKKYLIFDTGEELYILEVNNIEHFDYSPENPYTLYITPIYFIIKNERKLTFIKYLEKISVTISNRWLDNIKYQTDDLNDAIENMFIILETEKYNL